MAPQTRALAAISRDRRRYDELSPATRNQTVGAAAVGVPQHKIRDLFEVPASTINRTINNASDNLQGVLNSRSGRSQHCAERTKRAILLYAHQNPFSTYSQLLTDLQLDCSHSTVYRILKDQGIKDWIAKKRPLLSEATAQKRRDWCELHKH